MDGVLIKAFEREGKPARTRKEGFIPGVIYGDDLAGGKPVKFNPAELNRIIATHGHNAKVMVECCGASRSGFIKEIQRDSVTNKIIHIDVQAVNQDKIIHNRIPVRFEGISKLEQKKLILQINKDEINVSGKAALMPEYVIVNVEGKNPGDSFSAGDLHIDSQLKLLDDPGEILAVVTTIKSQEIEEAPAEDSEAEAEGN